MSNQSAVKLFQNPTLYKYQLIICLDISSIINLTHEKLKKIIYLKDD